MSTIDQSVMPAFEKWMAEQINQLSVDTLSLGVLTCTACPKVLGDYIIEYKGASMRLSTEKTYAFLQYAKAGELKAP
ncbi:MAG: hypothetical protein QNJ46_29120 [Leptolyngbyaceae cyanobacterium MO_188.B28]|nr:hypothetical protein [Leptolyngbyaceae cyanobacterium MO_188.B28]